MKTKRKGKWEVHLTKDDRTIVTNQRNGGKIICQTDCLANANLISNAPEMLALLKKMATDENELRFALCRLFGTKKGNSLSRQIKDLIAKA